MSSWFQLRITFKKSQMNNSKQIAKNRQNYKLKNITPKKQLLQTSGISINNNSNIINFLVYKSLY